MAGYDHGFDDELQRIADAVGVDGLLGKVFSLVERVQTRGS